MDNSVKQKDLKQPLTMAELLRIKAILTKDTIHSPTLLRKPRPTNDQIQRTEKLTRPLTGTEIRALTGLLQKKKPQPSPSTSVKQWNSSVKVDKTKSFTATVDGQLKFRTVKKVLNFQPKEPKKPEISAANTQETNSVAKKSFPVKDKTKSLPRISGVSKIAETPVIKKPHAQKVTNNSFKCNSDDSFLLREKEINEFQDKCNILEEETLERIADISPPFSIPFKDDTSIQDHFNNISLMGNTITNNNNTKMYDKELDFEENNKRKESVIVSLCEVDNCNDSNSKYFDLLELKKQKESNIKTLLSIIDTLNIMIGRETESLHNISTELKAAQSSEVVKQEDKENYFGSPKNSSTVIKAKLPCYKIPRKSICSTKVVNCKPVPNISDDTNKSNSKALSMYMEMKDKMEFLSTPLANRQNAVIPDTPAITSHNLQKQLEKLFN